MMLLFIIAFFVQSYFTLNLLPSLLGAGMLVYIIWVKSSFYYATKNLTEEFRRSITEKIFFADNPVNVNICYSNTASGPVFIKISDRIPEESFVLENSSLQEEFVMPGEEMIYAYSLVRKSRGLALFEGADATIQDRRRMFVIENFLENKDELPFQDSKDRIRKAEIVAKRSSKEEVPVEVKGHIQGEEYEGVREYAPGDNLSIIDWKSSSRLQTLLTKVLESHEHGMVYIMLDVSKSMRKSYKKVSKLNHGIMLSMQISKVFLAHENMTGFIAFDEYSIHSNISPSRRGSQYSNILSILTTLPDAFDVKEYDLREYEQMEVDENTKSFLSSLMPFLSKTKKKFISPTFSSGAFAAVNQITEIEGGGSLIIAISDLESNVAPIVSALRKASKKRHKVVLITPYSPWYGVRIEDMDTTEAEELYQNYLNKKRNLVKLKSAGVEVIEESPLDTISVIYPKIMGGLK